MHKCFHLKLLCNIIKIPPNKDKKYMRSRVKSIHSVVKTPQAPKPTAPPPFPPLCRLFPLPPPPRHLQLNIPSSNKIPHKSTATDKYHPLTQTKNWISRLAQNSTIKTKLKATELCELDICIQYVFLPNLSHCILDQASSRNCWIIWNVARQLHSQSSPFPVWQLEKD